MMLIYRLGQIAAALWLILATIHMADGMVIHDVAGFLTGAVLPAMVLWGAGWLIAVAVGLTLQGIGRLFHK